MIVVKLEFYSIREGEEFMQEMQERFRLQGHVATVDVGQELHWPDQCEDYHTICNHALDPECPECGETVWL